MNINTFVIIPSILAITTNIDYIHYFSFAEYLTKVFRSQATKAEIEFYIMKDVQKPRGLDVKFHFFHGAENENKIYYERPLLGKLNAKMSVENAERKVKVLVNKLYYNFVKLKMDNVYPPGCNLTDITTVKLLEAGYVPVHSSCVSLDGNGIVFFAPPDMGKSLTAFLAIKSGYNFLSEDITVLDEKYAYSCPLTSTFLHLLSNEKSSVRFYDFISKFSVLSYFCKKPKIDLFDIFGHHLKIDGKSKVGTVCLLEKGEETMQKMSKEEAFRKILIINRNEFSYYKNPLLLAYSYFNPTLDLNQLMKKEEKILSQILDKTDCFLLRAKKPENYIKLLMKNIK